MRFLKTTTTALLLLALAACGGGSSDPATSANGAVTVTPSLGQVWFGSVRLRNLQGALLAQGELGTAGRLTLNTLPDGYIVEVEGGTDAYYFDEGIGAVRPLPPGRILHAVSATARRDVAVTAFTELIYRRALALAGGSALTPAVIRQAEAEAATLFGAPDSGSFLAAPALIGHPLDRPDTTTAAGRHALRLAALAQHALTTRLATNPLCASDNSCAPLLDFIDDLAGDFADGTLDGMVGGTPGPSPFYAADGVATAAGLLAALQTASDAFTARQDAAQSLHTTDRLLGETLAGSYALVCDNAPVQLTITTDGSFKVQAPFGRFTLAAGKTSSEVRENAVARLYARSGLLIAAETESRTGPISSAPVGDGLIVVLNPEFPPFGVSPFVAVAADASGHGAILYRGEERSCSGFPAPASSLLLNTTRVSSWLPDGHYQCEASGPADLKIATVSAGVLSIEGQSWDMAGAFLAEETQVDPLVVASAETMDHLHSGDAVADTLHPLNILTLSTPGSGFVSIRRSLVSGKRYFNATLNNVPYQHCVTATAPPPPPPTDNCWGSSRFC